MRTVFFGTPAWAVPSFEALLSSDIDVVAVVTNPDRPAGRGMKVSSSPVKDAATEAGVDVLQPERVRDEGFIETFRALAPDVAVVVAYGKILPPALLEIPRLGFVNVHFSVLPAYRGAAPVQRAVMDGLDETGVSIMVLTEGMDEGPVLALETVPIAPSDTAGSVGDRLAAIGGPLLVRALEDYAGGRLQPVEQDHDRATYAPKIASDDARIDWSRPAEEIDAFVRGLQPAPGAWTTLRGRRLKVIEAAPSDSDNLQPGELGEGASLAVGTATVPLRLATVQPEGKKKMSGEEFLRGLHGREGAVFE